MLLVEARIKNTFKAYQVFVPGFGLPVAFIGLYHHGTTIEILDYNCRFFPKQTFTTIEECKAYLKHYIDTRSPKFID